MTNEELIALAKSGDMNAYNQLFRQNDRLVYKIAHDYNTSLPLDERVSLVWIGTLKAYQSFDPSKGKKFTSWMTVCGKSEISHYLQAFKTKKRTGKTVTIDSVVHEDDGNFESSWLGYSDARYEQVEDRLLLSEINDYCENLNDLKRIIYKEMIIGETTCRELASRLGFSHAWIASVRKKLINEIRDYVISKEAV